MFVLVYLNRLHLHLSSGIYVLAVRKLQGEVSIGHVQSIQSGGIPMSAHKGTS